jgi:hypothetical protein
MGHADPPIRHHNHQIPQAQLEARLPTHAQNDDLSIEVPSFEQSFDRVERLHSSSSPGEGAFAPEPNLLCLQTGACRERSARLSRIANYAEPLILA